MVIPILKSDEKMCSNGRLNLRIIDFSKIDLQFFLFNFSYFGKIITIKYLEYYQKKTLEVFFPMVLSSLKFDEKIEHIGRLNMNVPDFSTVDLPLFLFHFSYFGQIWNIHLQICTTLKYVV